MSDAGVEVAVLGPVEIRGAVGPFARSASRDLVVYLAFHRSGVRNDECGTALWPHRSVAPPTVHSTASVARRALGVSSDGTEHFPRHGRVLRLGASVTTDVDRFVDAAADPRPFRWMEALELVRGQIFEGLGLSDWTILEGTRADLESMVSRTALKTADHHLTRGMGVEAERAVRCGLRASPYDERLYRALLRSAEVQGNRMGLRSAMTEILSVAAGGMGHQGGGRTGGSRRDPRPSLHPETVALYRALAKGDLPAARGDPVRL